MFSTSPASSPPSTTRPQLILPIVTSGREKSDQHAAPTVWVNPTPVKQLCAYGTTRTATIPPIPSGTVATPLGTTHSDPSTCRLKWYNPRRSTSVPSHTSSPRGRNRAGCQAFQSPAIATVRASGIRNRTRRLSPRGSGTSGAHLGTAATGGGRGDL